MSESLTLNLTLIQLFHPNPASLYFFVVDELRSVRARVRVMVRVGAKVRVRVRIGAKVRVIGFRIRARARVRVRVRVRARVRARVRVWIRGLAFRVYLHQ